MKSSRIARPLLVLLLWGFSSGCSTAEGPDPWRETNSGTFGFNEGVDRYALEPVAKGWAWVLPDFALTGVSNFFDNLRVVRTFLNDTFQAKPVAAIQDLGRFGVNTTVGLAGLIDVASHIGIPHNEEDFGQTLGRWGAGTGPYLVVPFIGASNVRDALAIPIDAVTVPSAYGIGLIDVVNRRAILLEEIAESRATAIDFYLFVRDAYLQNREREVRDGAALPRETQDDLYELDEEFDDPEETPETAPADGPPQGHDVSPPQEPH